GRNIKTSGFEQRDDARPTRTVGPRPVHKDDVASCLGLCHRAAGRDEGKHCDQKELNCQNVSAYHVASSNWNAIAIRSELVDVNRRVPIYLCGTVNPTTWLAPGIGLCVASASSSLTLCGPGFSPTRTTV